jgi:DinB superfamily
MNEPSLREHLVDLLTWGHAHVDFDAAVADLPTALRGVRPEGSTHSPWELLEHLRLAQVDILEFSRDPDHVSPPWPVGYWPPSPAPPDDEVWETSVASFRADLQAMCDLVADPASDLFTPFPWGKGQTLLREAMLLADHNAYHVGQIVLVRQLQGAWPPG